MCCAYMRKAKHELEMAINKMKAHCHDNSEYKEIYGDKQDWTDCYHLCFTMCINGTKANAIENEIVEQSYLESMRSPSKSQVEKRRSCKDLIIVGCSQLFTTAVHCQVAPLWHAKVGEPDQLTTGFGISSKTYETSRARRVSFLQVDTVLQPCIKIWG